MGESFTLTPAEQIQNNTVQQFCQAHASHAIVLFLTSLKMTCFTISTTNPIHLPGVRGGRGLIDHAWVYVCNWCNLWLAAAAACVSVCVEPRGVTDAVLSEIDRTPSLLNQLNQRSQITQISDATLRCRRRHVEAPTTTVKPECIKYLLLCFRAGA